MGGIPPIACNCCCPVHTLLHTLSQKCGTTSLAEHLKRHPALSGTAGLPYHETLSKESHFFAGVGRAAGGNTGSYSRWGG